VSDERTRDDGRGERVSKRCVVAFGAVVVACASAILASCTFLLPFDQISDDGGFAGDADDEAEVDAAVYDAGHEAEASANDNAKVCTRIDGGAPIKDGWYCANHDTNEYMGAPNDLIHCVEGGVVQIESCVHGCVFMPTAFDDECDECFGRPNGNYCGRDFPDWPNRDPPVENVLIVCRAGQKQNDVVCKVDGGSGCISGDAGGPALSCAQ
jgi:hypothetical protein